MNLYKPQPVDTSSIKLECDVLALAEKLAENTHDVWAKARINEGWTWGERRDESLKTHPCIVPYAQLPESEKEYDRATSLETLRMIQKLGYELVKR